jgi:glycosyltransferase involved in cell wall biosynthesis
MLSILIPTYNYDITGLVSDLHQQAVSLQTDFEIIVMEDASQLYLKENASIQNLSNCFYQLLPQNIGRSAIRNKLADTAKYKHLLFIDGDAQVYRKDFISRYLVFCDDNQVVIGGTAYDENVTDPQFSLRLKYGRVREANMDYMLHHSNNNFATFNFLIPKTIFNQVRFDEGISGYGHEDTLFGHRLRELGYNFIRIDNPLIHKGIDENKVFLKKTEESVLNLYKLYKSGKYTFLVQESKLLTYYEKLSKYHLNGIISLKFRLIKKCMEMQLCSRNPSLVVYDFYKLCLLVLFSRKSDKLTAN